MPDNDKQDASGMKKSVKDDADGNKISLGEIFGLTGHPALAEEQTGNESEESERLREQRDSLYRQARDWEKKRDELIAKIQELTSTAEQHRNIRDLLNQKVKDVKAVRDKKNGQCAEIMKEYQALKESYDSSEMDDKEIKRLKKEFNDLELKQQMGSLSTNEERKLVSRLMELDHKIKMIADRRITADNLERLSKKYKITKSDAETAHKLVTEYSERAQTEHEIMTSINSNISTIRKQADEAQKYYVKCKETADSLHIKYIESRGH